ncbi:MAG TPA: response regulator [Ktedonobacterales bacterium]|nr:response regulator [Ktedonobacterales bacterium]
MGAVTRVLIVDDDEGIRETIRFALEDAGYTVAEASDGLAALKQLRAGRERMVVLLDLMMPGLDGAGLLGAVAADAQLSSQYAFVLITANTKTLTLAFATLLQNLSVPVLTKPFDIDTLLDAVATAAHRLVR